MTSVSNLKMHLSTSACSIASTKQKLPDYAAQATLWVSILPLYDNNLPPGMRLISLVTYLYIHVISISAKTYRQEVLYYMDQIWKRNLIVPTIYCVN
jgi:hypothetical protein